MPNPTACRLRFIRSAFALAAVAALGSAPAGAEPGYTAAERAYVEALLSGVQLRSFMSGREFCGYLVVLDDRSLSHTGPFRGRADSCDMAWPEEGEVIASWHTHGAYDPDFWNEVPSVSDLEGDIADQVDGWVATPGGRLWHIEWERGEAMLVCGRACLVSDPDYDPSETGSVAPRYSLETLERRLQAE